METFQRPELKERPAKNKDTDKAALQAIAQAAIDVELFTLPLYMVSMYSIQGMHQITSKGNDFYRGRLWPGASPARDPASSPNATAFNHFFSVFIDEMLHLQLASNIAKALGVMPSYNSKALVDENYGWVCYGPDNTVLPHILDFQDTVEGYNDIKVKLDALTVEQNRLFLAIEQNEEDAKKIIDPDKVDKYFPPVPIRELGGGRRPPDVRHHRPHVQVPLAVHGDRLRRRLQPLRVRLQPRHAGARPLQPQQQLPQTRVPQDARHGLGRGQRTLCDGEHPEHD